MYNIIFVLHKYVFHIYLMKRLETKTNPPAIRPLVSRLYSLNAVPY